MRLGERIFLIGVALTVIVTLSLIPDNPKSQQRLLQPSPVVWEDVADDPAREISLRWQGIIAHPAGKEGSWIERTLEERFNLEIDPLFMDVNTYSRRRPLMLVGGDIPDVMWSGDPLAVRANLRNGFIMEIPYELILKHCPTYVEYVNRFGKETWLYTQYNGRNYGLPTVCAIANRPRTGCWRLDWLKKVGLDRVPETVGEMHEAFRRFRYEDPDGNGILDTYGWTPNVSHWSMMFTEVFAAYGILPFDLMERDGEVVWGGILPDVREVLRELHAWYAEGLLDPDFPLDTQGRNNEIKFINGKVGYLYPVDSYGDYDSNEEGSLFGKTRAFSPEAEVVPGPPLIGPEGHPLGRTWGGAAHIIQFGRHLENEPEKVVRVLKMIEAVASDETLYMEARWGLRGEHWDYMPEPFVRSDGRPAKAGINLLPPYDAEDRRRDNAAELLGSSTTFFFPSTFDPIYDEQFMAPAELEWLDRYRSEAWSIMNVLGKSDVVGSSGRYLKDLVNYQITLFIEIVIGDRTIDEFDAFVSEWRRRGGDIILEEANQMYQQMNEIYQCVGAGAVSK
jgi:putative aldouronate transport system substrate-binding protein